MKDTIYTIPLTDAFKAQDECPFCFIHRKLEQDQISFTLGASYMEDDIRSETDKLGFCDTHYKKLYDYGNRLGLALIMQTHYRAIASQVDGLLEKGVPTKVSLFEKLTKNKNGDGLIQNPISHAINELSNSCYICERIDLDMDRYIKTFFYLLSNHEDFKSLYSNSQGLCLKHFSMLIEKAPFYLKDDTQTFFLASSKEKLAQSLGRIEDEISWFIDKYDYRNADKPMGTSIDAIPRGIQKLAGIYVQDEPFKTTK